MWSTRARIAAMYAILLLATLIVFSAAIYYARRTTANRELGELALRAAEQLENRLGTAARMGKRIVSRDSLLVTTDDSGTPASPRACQQPERCRWVPLRTFPDLRNVLDPLPGYFLLIGADRRLIYSSAAVRQLPSEQQQDYQEFLYQTALYLYSVPGAPVLTPRREALGGRMLLAARAVSDTALQPDISRIVFGFPASQAEVAPGLLLGTLVLVAPLMLLISVAVAYVLAGNTFKPVDVLINEVEAITDGRSLHRRLPGGEADEELARLADTLNRMIERLQTSFGALRRFTADASHELKTPLTVVRANVERAMHPSATPDERLPALEEAMQEIARMSDLVDSLLTLARADEGRFDLHREPTPLEPLVRDVFETAVILGEGAGVTVSLPLVEDAVVLADATRLRQLFLNLITNAIKYTPRGGHVEMTLSHRNNNEVGFAVRDTGAGIAAADLPYVFDRFWRADRARSRRPGPTGPAGTTSETRTTTAVDRGGFGLGLAISQWIAQAHGGTLTAQSRLGRGSTFTVLLPMVEGRAA